MLDNPAEVGNCTSLYESRVREQKFRIAGEKAICREIPLLVHHGSGPHRGLYVRQEHGRHFPRNGNS
jgi:hypothetical protein